MREVLSLQSGPFEMDESYNLAVVRGPQGVLLGRKTRGFGKGMLVLPGGKNQYYLDADGVGLVPVEHGVGREIRQETGLHIDPRSLEQIGMLCIAAEDDNRNVAVYEATSPKLALTDSDELKDLAWYPEAEIPYAEMPADYKLWLPHTMVGYAVTAFFETQNGDVKGGSIFRHRRNPLGRIERLLVG